MEPSGLPPPTGIGRINRMRYRDVYKFLRLDDKNNAPNAISAKDSKTFLSIAAKMADPLPSTLWDASAQRIEIHDGDDIFDVVSVEAHWDHPDILRGRLAVFVADPTKAFGKLQRVHWKTLVDVRWGRDAAKRWPEAQIETD